MSVPLASRHHFASCAVVCVTAPRILFLFFSLALLYTEQRKRGDTIRRKEPPGVHVRGYLYRREGEGIGRSPRPALIVRVPLQVGPTSPAMRAESESGSA